MNQGVIRMKFKSKKDILFFIVIWGSIIGTFLVEMTNRENNIPEFLFKVAAGSIIFLLIWMWFGTTYTIGNSELTIKYGPFRWKIAIEEIQKIRKVKNPFTAPSLSVDRLEISYGKYEVIQVSPENQDIFIKCLLEENLDIKIENH
jgi:hypothetical protein